MTESHDDPAADQIGAALSRLLGPLQTGADASTAPPPPAPSDQPAPRPPPFDPPAAAPERHLPAVVEAVTTHQVGPARVRSSPPPPPPPWEEARRSGREDERRPTDPPPPPFAQRIMAATTRHEAPPEPPPAPPSPPPPPPAAPHPPAAPSGPTPPPPSQPAEPRRPRERVFVAVPPRDVDGERHRTRGLRRAVATLLRQRRRLALSTLIVALGVAYLAGSLSLLGRVSNGLDDLAGIGTERADLVVEGDVAIDSPFEQTRRLVPEGLVPSLQRIPGVAAAEGRIEDSTVLVDRFFEPIVKLGLTEQPLGANWPAVAKLNPYQFVGQGRAPQGASEVVIDHASAEHAGIHVGDHVYAATKAGGLSSLQVVGIVTRSGRDLPQGSSLALFDTATARHLFDRTSDDNSIGIVLAPGADRARVAQEIRATLPYGTSLVDGKTFERHRATGLSKTFDLIRVLLLGFAGLAVVVGAFTVANSNALLFARRRQGFALLRLVGASPAQLRGAAAVEALLVGLAAVVVGIPLGLLVGRGIELTLGALGTAVPAAGSPVSATMIVASALVGLAVTVLTALLPARDAARSSPIVALTRSDDASAESTVPVAARLALLVVAGALLGAVLGFAVGRGSGAGIGAAVGAGVFLLSWAIPRALGQLVTATTRALVGPSRSMRSLTALRSRRARSRAASTTAALLIATAVVAGLSTLSASFVASLGDQVGKIVKADLVVDSGTFTRGGLSSTLVSDLADAPGVTAVSGVRVGAASISGHSFRLAAVNGATVDRLLDLGITNPPPRLGEDEMFLSDELAKSVGAQTGSRVDLVFDNAIQPMRVAGTFSVRSPLIGEAVIDSKLLARVTPASVDLLALVDIDPAQPQTATAAVRQLAKSYGVSSVYPPAKLVDQRFDLVRGFERVIQWMLLFSVALAVVGIANTLQLSVNERRRELGLLRSVGGGREQVIRLVLVEAAALSIVGAVVGSLVGLAGAFATVRALANLGLGVFRAPTLVLVGIAVAALVLGVLGAWLPAMAASRTGIMEAIGEDDESGGRGLLGSAARYRDRRRSRRLGTVSQDRRQEGRSRPPAGSPTAEPAAPPDETEDDMARCYNCGNDPGSAEECQVCGAALQPEPAGMFSTAPTAGAAAGAAGGGRPSPAGGRPTNGLWSTEPGQNGNGTHHEDIVDAAVIEDDEDEGAGGTPLGSIFDDVRTGAREDATSAREDVTFRRPPAEEPPPEEPPWSSPPPQSAPPPPPPPEPPRHEAYAMPPTGQWYPGAPTYQPPPAYQQPSAYQQQYQQQQEPTYAPPPPPPPYAAPQPPPAGEQFGTPPSMLPVHVPSADPQGLGAAVVRMSPDAQQLAAPALLVAGVLLGPDERVVGTVLGWMQGLPTIAILSTARVLIVAERRWKPVIETFPLRPALTVYGRHVDGRATMTFQDTDHMVTIEQIPDVSLAVEMATATRTQSTNQQGF